MGTSLFIIFFEPFFRVSSSSSSQYRHRPCAILDLFLPSLAAVSLDARSIPFRFVIPITIVLLCCCSWPSSSSSTTDNDETECLSVAGKSSRSLLFSRVFLFYVITNEEPFANSILFARHFPARTGHSFE